jgi:hypothetical protein
VKWEARQMINKNRWVADNNRRGIFFPTWRGKVLRDKNEEEQNKIARKIYALAYEEELYSGSQVFSTRPKSQNPFHEGLQRA